MKNLMKLSVVLVAAALVFSSCNCFKKMAKNRDDINLTVTPEILTLNNGIVAADFEVTEVFDRVVGVAARIAFAAQVDALIRAAREGAAAVLLSADVRRAVIFERGAAVADVIDRAAADGVDDGEGAVVDDGVLILRVGDSVPRQIEGDIFFLRNYNALRYAAAEPNRCPFFGIFDCLQQVFGRHNRRFRRPHFRHREA